MALVFYIIFTILFIISGIKVRSWSTIVKLGFGSGAPLPFLKHSQIYRAVPTALFILALVMSSLAPTSGSATIMLIVLLISFLVVCTRGRKRGIEKYRDVLREMLEYKELSKEKKLDIKKQLKKSDKDLYSHFSP